VSDQVSHPHKHCWYLCRILFLRCLLQILTNQDGRCNMCDCRLIPCRRAVWDILQVCCRSLVVVLFEISGMCAVWDPL
jgi:hypothetical protein